MLGQILGVAASVMEGDPDACQALETTLGLWRMAGGGLAVPVLLAELAEGCLRAGDHPRARAALEDATTMMAQTGQRGPEPDVIRISARLDAAGGAEPDDVVKRMCSAADLALEHGSLRLGARAIRDAADVLDGHLDAEVAEVAARLCARLPRSAATERRQIERLLSASA
jgi:hypothetical protein